MQKVEVELWDTSGSKRYGHSQTDSLFQISYENCWPAIFKGINGVVFVYNPNNAGHGKILEEWYLLNILTFWFKGSQFLDEIKLSETHNFASLDSASRPKPTVTSLLYVSIDR